MILNQCSSFGEVVDVASQTIGIPYVRVDMPMAQKAVELGERITVVATVRSTLGPSVRLVKRAAAEAGKSVTVQELLVDGALDVLMKQGDRDLHYKMVLDAIAAAEKTSDVIVSAQGSVAILEPQLTKLAKPILTSPRSGVADQSPARKLSTVLPQSVTLSMFSAFVPVLDSRDSLSFPRRF